MSRRAIVVGAGIGGLAAGRALRDSGFEVEILERSATLDPTGAGISLWPNAVHVLRGLGVAAALPEPPTLEANAGLRRWDGRPLAQTDPAAIERRYGAPIMLLQRNTLHRALLGGGIEELVRTEAEVVKIGREDGKVHAELAGGARVEADLLIGADGIRSRVREALLDDGPPRHSGLVAYRALIDPPAERVRQGEYWGPSRVFGLVPVDGDRLYWFATRRGESEEPVESDPIAGLLDRHQGWASEIRRALEATPPQAVLRHALLDRKPGGRWVDGRVALLGDAAHPMLPFLGQGACQALEDAEALSRALADGAGIPAALETYEAQRRRRASRIAKLSAQMGRLAHLRAAPLRVVRDRAMAMTPERIRMRQLDSILRPAA